MLENHLLIEDLSYSKDTRTWLEERYGRERGEKIWGDVVAKYNEYLNDLPDYGISEIHGKLIRCGTCGNSDRCDYLVVGDHNPITELYMTGTDENEFIVSKKK